MAKRKKGKVEEVKEEIPIVEEKIEMRNIKIVIESLEQIEPEFTATDIYVTVAHSDTNLGQSDKILVQEKSCVPIDCCIEMPVNIASENVLNNLLICPLYFSAWQVPGEADIALYPSRSETSEDTNSTVVGRESIESLYEAILAVKFDELGEGEEVPKKQKNVKIKDKKKKSGKKEKGKKKDIKTASKDSKGSKRSKGSKTSKSTKSKSSKGSKTSKGSKEKKVDPANASPVCIGYNNLDLLPFFLGNQSICETIPLYQEVVHLDDNMVTKPNLPQLKVTILINNPLFDDTDEETRLTNMFSVTIESIYNLTSFFCEELNYKIATLFPQNDLTFKPICIENGVYKEGLNVLKEYKLWPNLAKINNFSSRTTQSIDEDMSMVKNKIGAPLNDETTKVNSRITWNIFKRCWLTQNQNDLVQKNIIRYRKWPIEIHLSSNEALTETKSVKSKSSNKSKTSNKSSKKSKNSSQSSKSTKKCPLSPELQHLMGFVDISSLLYPGVTKTRVACELRTFNQKELTQETGFDNSYFTPKEENISTARSKSPDKGKGAKKGKDDKKSEKGKAKGKKSEEDKKSEKGKAKGKKSEDDKKSEKGKGKKSEDDKKSEKGKGKDKKEEKALPEPPEPEPSKPILNEKGEPTFIIFEFELMKPFQERRTLTDLTDELLTLIPQREAMKPSVLNVQFANQLYKETIIKIASEINIQYQEFQNNNTKNDLLCFIQFLQSHGYYQKYYTTLSRAIILMVREKFNYSQDFKNSEAFSNYVSHIYTYFQNILNSEIHYLMSCKPTKVSRFNYLYLAKEALENNAITLAERYHLQAVQKDSRNPDLWFHFAVFYLPSSIEKSYECLKEALALQLNHRYSLLLFGIILYEKNDYYMSENTLLTLMTHYPKYIEGWVCLYLFYQNRKQYEGRDYCLIKIIETQKNPADNQEDYYYDEEEFIWQSNICNSKNVFYQTGLFLIKIGAYKFADMALSTDNFVQDGAYRYFQAVILYFLKDYYHALEHLAVAQKLHGPDYAVNSLIGHCHYRLGNYDDAKEAYEFIIAAFNRPEDMHMLYMNMAYISEAENNLPLAKKYMSYVCKYSPTPYSWLMLGILFYKDNNYVNAEACFEESNILDIRLPETWAYLALINLKFNKMWEAQKCYTQMHRFDLKNEVLLNEVYEEMVKCQGIHT